MVRLLLALLLVAGCSKYNRIDELAVTTGCHASCEWCIDLQVYCAENIHAEDWDDEKRIEVNPAPTIRIEHSDVEVEE